jgi:hypothetical protein
MHHPTSLSQISAMPECVRNVTIEIAVTLDLYTGAILESGLVYLRRMCRQ